MIGLYIEVPLYIYLSDAAHFFKPPRCCSGRASASGAGGRGSIPGRVTTKTLEMVVMAVLHGAPGCGVSITTDWLVSGSMDQ